MEILDFSMAFFSTPRTKLKNQKKTFSVLPARLPTPPTHSFRPLLWASNNYNSKKPTRIPSQWTRKWPVMETWEFLSPQEFPLYVLAHATALLFYVLAHAAARVSTCSHTRQPFFLRARYFHFISFYCI